jgi:hypothetical protein
LAQTVNWGDRVGRATSAAGCVIFLRIRQSRSQNGKFESISLQRRVCCEPDFLDDGWRRRSERGVRVVAAISAGPEGQTQILFADQSTMTVGPRSNMVID